MQNEQSINNVLSEFDRAQAKARRFSMAATVVGVIAAIGMIALIAAIAYKYTSTEKTLTGEVTQTRSELETKLGELDLAKTELDTKNTELTRLLETVKTASGPGSADVITSLQRDLTANQQKLANADQQITELKGLMATMQNPNDAVAALTQKLTEKEKNINNLKDQVAVKDQNIAVINRTIGDKDKEIAAKNNEIAVKVDTISKKDREIAKLVAEKDRLIDKLNEYLRIKKIPVNIQDTKKLPDPQKQPVNPNQKP